MEMETFKAGDQANLAALTRVVLWRSKSFAVLYEVKWKNKDRRKGGKAQSASVPKMEGILNIGSPISITM